MCKLVSTGVCQAVERVCTSTLSLTSRQVNDSKGRKRIDIETIRIVPNGERVTLMASSSLTGVCPKVPVKTMFIFFLLCFWGMSNACYRFTSFIQYPSVSVHGCHKRFFIKYLLAVLKCVLLIVLFLKISWCCSVLLQLPDVSISL